MFSPSPEPGNNPEIGGGMSEIPPTSFHFGLSSIAEVSWDDRMFLEDSMDSLVASGEVSKSTADWLLMDGLRSIALAADLKNRFTRPGGFNGINAL
jgi:hypothetical protein